MGLVEDGFGKFCGGTGLAGEVHAGGHLVRNGLEGLFHFGIGEQRVVEAVLRTALREQDDGRRGDGRHRERGEPECRVRAGGFRQFAGRQGLPQAPLQAVRDGYGRFQRFPLEFFEAEVFNFFQGFAVMYLNFLRACESSTRKVR